MLEHAIKALQSGDYQKARALVAALPDEVKASPQAFLIDGLGACALEDWQAAQTCFAHAVQQHPKNPQLWFNLGWANEQCRRPEAARMAYEKSLALDDRQPACCGNLANVLITLKQYELAEHVARRALDLGAPKETACNTLGLALKGQKKFEESMEAFQTVLAFNPHSTAALGNAANTAVDALDFTTAWPLFAAARAIEDKPLFRRAEGMARLLAGDYEKGWKLYEARLEMPLAKKFQAACPRYQGQDLTGKKLLLLAEQGFGDTLHFCRFVPSFQALGAEVLLCVQKPLQRLLAASLPCTVLSEDVPPPDADYFLPLLSAPFALGAFQPKDWPAAPYLKAPPAPLLPQRSTTQPNIGLVWAGSLTNSIEHERGIALTQLAPLWHEHKANYYAFFLGDALQAIGDFPILRLDSVMGDFADTAALMLQLDCLITTDTAAAHLAGALGIKTFLLLSYCPDWRWGTNGQSCPWYPSLALLRQPQPGDWGSVVGGLVKILSDGAPGGT